MDRGDHAGDSAVGTQQQAAARHHHRLQVELYNIKEDPTQINDLAAKIPNKLKQLQDLFYSEAAKYNVLPLDNTTLARWNSPRPT